jgi:hypothetical protein
MLPSIAGQMADKPGVELLEELLYLAFVWYTRW